MIDSTIERGRAVDLRGTASHDSLSPFALVRNAPFVGNDLSVLPATSAFGMLARLVRLNACEPVDLFRLFGIRSRRSDDLAAVMTFSTPRQVALARALRLPSVPPTWSLEVWLPFQSSLDIFSAEWIFRYCPQCIHSGYHTLLHQLSWIHRCPWHGAALRRTCPRCGENTPTYANWAFDQNLACPCGHELLSTTAALKRSAGPPSHAADFISHYLAWAAEERKNTLLVVPELPSDIDSALADLIKLPRNWIYKCGGSKSGRRERGLLATTHVEFPSRGAIAQLDTLRQDRPGFLTVPEPTRSSIANVAANLALKLPTSTLTNREMSLFLAGAGIGIPAEFKPAQRKFSSVLSTLPPWEVAGHQFLNLSCVHPIAYRSIIKLVDIALNHQSLVDYYERATTPELNLLIKACGHLLTRGYAEGLRATLSRHIPDLYAMNRDAPHLTQPWILATRDQTRLVNVRTIWKPVASTNTAAELLEEADALNQRRERVRGRARPGKTL